MKWVKIGNRTINLDHVVMIEDVPSDPPSVVVHVTFEHVWERNERGGSSEKEFLAEGRDAETIRAAIADRMTEVR